jgi:outer membrane lipoprotein SlyB
MHTPNTLAAVVIVCAAGLSVFSITSCADSNVATGRTPAAAQAEPVQTLTSDAMRPRTRAEVKAELKQALANGWHMDKAD